MPIIFLISLGKSPWFYAYQWPLWEKTGPLLTGELSVSIYRNISIELIGISAYCHQDSGYTAKYFCYQSWHFRWRCHLNFLFFICIWILIFWIFLKPNLIFSIKQFKSLPKKNYLSKQRKTPQLLKHLLSWEFLNCQTNLGILEMVHSNIKVSSVFSHIHD